MKVRGRTCTSVVKDEEEGNQETTNQPNPFSGSPGFLHLLARSTLPVCFRLRIMQNSSFRSKSFHWKLSLQPWILTREETNAVLLSYIKELSQPRRNRRMYIYLYYTSIILFEEYRRARIFTLSRVEGQSQVDNLYGTEFIVINQIFQLDWSIFNNKIKSATNGYKK